MGIHTHTGRRKRGRKERNCLMHDSRRRKGIQQMFSLNKGEMEQSPLQLLLLNAPRICFRKTVRIFVYVDGLIVSGWHIKPLLPPCSRWPCRLWGRVHPSRIEEKGKSIQRLCPRGNSTERGEGDFAGLPFSRSCLRKLSEGSDLQQHGRTWTRINVY